MCRWVKEDNTATKFKLELRIINYIYVHVYNFKNYKLILKQEKEEEKQKKEIESKRRHLKSTRTHFVTILNNFRITLTIICDHSRSSMGHNLYISL